MTAGAQPGRTGMPAFGGRAALRLSLGIAAAVFVFDQLSKWVVLAQVMDPPRVIPVLPGFNLVLVFNRGVSFGLFGGDSAWWPYVLSALAVAVSVALALWARHAGNRLLAAALGAIIGGALGNVIDRLRFGAVVDFLDLYLPGTALPHWPAFNIADSAIVVGVALVALDGLFAGRGKPT